MVKVNHFDPIVGTLGVLGATGIIAVTSKIKGGAVGMKGSPAHIMTNPNLDKQDKKDVFVELTKENFKDLGKGAAATGVAAGAAAIATAKSGKVSGAVQKVISKAGEALSKVNISGNSLKDVVKNSNIYKNFSALPTPAKAAILAGSTLLGLLLSLNILGGSSKAGYIEGKHEHKEA